MDKEDLIYDIVCEIRDQNNKRFESLETEVKNLKTFKDKCLGAFILISIIGTIITDYIKHLLFNN